MQIAPFNYIRKSPNYDSSKWQLCNSSSVSSQSNLLGYIEMMKEEHDRFISELARHSNEVSKSIDTSENDYRKIPNERGTP